MYKQFNFFFQILYRLEQIHFKVHFFNYIKTMKIASRKHIDGLPLLCMSLFFSSSASPLEEPRVVERIHNILRDSD